MADTVGVFYYMDIAKFDYQAPTVDEETKKQIQASSIRRYLGALHNRNIPPLKDPELIARLNNFFQLNLPEDKRDRRFGLLVDTDLLAEQIARHYVLSFGHRIHFMYMKCYEVVNIHFHEQKLEGDLSLSDYTREYPYLIMTYQKNEMVNKWLANLLSTLINSRDVNEQYRTLIIASKPIADFKDIPLIPIASLSAKLTGNPKIDQNVPSIATLNLGDMV